MLIRRAINTFILFFALSGAVVAYAAEPASWTLKRNSNGIKVYQQPTPSGYALTRGELTMPAAMSSIITVMNDRNSCPRWVYACKQGYLVKQYSQTQRLDYTVIDSPLWYEDRDMYIYTHTHLNQDARILTIRLSGRENHDAGLPGRVRIQAIQGFWQLREETRQTTHVLYQIYSNPRLPASIFLDAYMVKSVFQTLSRLSLVAHSVTPDENLLVPLN